MTKSLYSSICWLVSSMKSFVSSESQASWDHCLKQLRHLLLASPSDEVAGHSSMASLLRDTTSLVLSLLSAGSESILSSGRERSSSKMLRGLSDFHSEILKWTKKLLESTVALFSLTLSDDVNSKSSDLDASRRHVLWLILSGRCWMCQGHLQSVLLAPRGVVDPAQKTAVKLKCVLEEVRRTTKCSVTFLAMFRR